MFSVSGAGRLVDWTLLREDPMPMEVRVGRTGLRSSIRTESEEKNNDKGKKKKGGQKRVLEFAAQIVEGTRVWPPASP